MQYSRYMRNRASSPNIFFSAISSFSVSLQNQQLSPVVWDQLQIMKSFLSGGLASVIAKSATAPFSRVTILMQIQSASIGRKSATEICSEIYHKDGLRAFWRGNLASCIHRFPYSGVTFLVQDLSAKFLKPGKLSNSAVDFASGALGGGVAACLTYPLDVVRLRLSSQTGPNLHYCGICHTVDRIAKEQGTRGFYRGLVPTLMHVVPSFAINFQVFGSLKRAYETSHPGASIPLAETFSYGCGAGFFSSALLFPIDLVRRQMQADGHGGLPEKFSGIRDVVRAVYARNGVRGFYNGLPSELVKVVPFVGIMFMSVEWVRKLDWPFEDHLRPPGV